MLAGGIPHAFNDAASGAIESNLVAQATNAVNQGFDYVAIEMGGNDACKPTEAQMTSVANYEIEFHNALTTLTNGLPNTHIFVASAPDIKQTLVRRQVQRGGAERLVALRHLPSDGGEPTSTARTDVDRRNRVRSAGTGDAPRTDALAVVDE